MLPKCATLSCHERFLYKSFQLSFFYLQCIHVVIDPHIYWHFKILGWFLDWLCIWHRCLDIDISSSLTLALLCSLLRLLWWHLLQALWINNRRFSRLPPSNNKFPNNNHYPEKQFLMKSQWQKNYNTDTRWHTISLTCSKSLSLFPLKWESWMLTIILNDHHTEVHYSRLNRERLGASNS